MVVVKVHKSVPDEMVAVAAVAVAREVPGDVQARQGGKGFIRGCKEWLWWRWWLAGVRVMARKVYCSEIMPE